MANNLTFRELTPEDLPSIAEIDRSETIDGQYTFENGQLAFQEKRIDVHGWYPSALTDHIRDMGQAIAEGGAAFGAFDGDLLVGIVGLVTGPVGGDPTVMQLEPMYVSAPYRNRGIGKRLAALVAERARSLGARGLYISAIPTRNSADAYLRMGAVPLSTPDPVLFEKEPEDIHLMLWLGNEEGTSSTGM